MRTQENSRGCAPRVLGAREACVCVGLRRYTKYSVHNGKEMEYKVSEGVSERDDGGRDDCRYDLPADNG